MQKCTKTCLSLLLTLAILCTGAALVPAGAKASAQNPNGCTPQTSCDYSPTIIVPGINQSVTYLYDDDGEKTSLGGGIIFPDTANLPLPQLIFRLLLSFVAQRDLGLTKIVYQTVAQMFEPQRVDNEGRYVHDLRTDIIGRVSDMTPEQRNLCL
ncbi:MAG: hypothetical protein LBB50_05315, partial [Oscillospiraceae bacterium]|nr:hypothetical protein [Oscillospiraceae bacterium]